MLFTFARGEHRLLAVAHLDAELLQFQHHRRLDDVDAERHVAHALGFEQRLDFAAASRNSTPSPPTAPRSPRSPARQ
jgi:hypothetical protein